MYNPINLSHYTDDELVILYCKGNESAFSTIFQRWNSKIIRFIIKFSSVDTETAKDISQLVFTKIYSAFKKNQYRGENFKGWIIIITKNTIFGHFRGLNNKLVFLKDDKIDSQCCSFEIPDIILENKEENEILSKMCNSLEVRNREVFKLRLQNFKLREIGEHTGLNLSTVKDIIYETRKKFMLDVKNFL